MRENITIDDYRAQLSRLFIIIMIIHNYCLHEYSRLFYTICMDNFKHSFPVRRRNNAQGLETDIASQNIHAYYSNSEVHNITNENFYVCVRLTMSYVRA